MMSFKDRNKNGFINDNPNIDRTVSGVIEELKRQINPKIIPVSYEEAISRFGGNEDVVRWYDADPNLGPQWLNIETDDLLFAIEKEKPERAKDFNGQI